MFLVLIHIGYQLLSYSQNWRESQSPMKKIFILGSHWQDLQSLSFVDRMEVSQCATYNLALFRRSGGSRKIGTGNHL